MLRAATACMYAYARFILVRNEEVGESRHYIVSLLLHLPLQKDKGG